MFFFRASVVASVVFVCAGIVGAVVRDREPECTASSFSRDLGNTHCAALVPHPTATIQDACAAACCALGDTCQTWQWCEPGKTCATGFWPQPGALARGNDVPGWPRNTTVAAATAACESDPKCAGITYHSRELRPQPNQILNFYLKTAGAGPVDSTTWSRHVKAKPGCFVGRLDDQCANGTDGWNSRALPPRSDGPCDLLDAAGTPCVAAHSVTRALYANFTGALYRVIRGTDMAGLDILASLNTGVARTADQEAFCHGVACWILRIFDQSPHGNHLDTSPAGGACNHPLSPVNASRERISLGGRGVYGAYFEGNMGYRRDKTSGVATGQTSETMYMVTRGDHVNGGCCFDYGNAETNNLDDGQGTMEAVYFGTSGGWGRGQGKGPWVMADLENGLWAGSQKVSPAPSLGNQFVIAMAKGRAGGFALKGGNAQTGQLQKLYEGPRPPGYEVMQLQGAIILGTGGDNSCSAVGTFYEGVMTASYTTDATDTAVHANVVAAGYGM